MNLIISMGVSYAYWASEVNGNQQSGLGNITIGDWGIPIYTPDEFYEFATKTNSVLTDHYYLHNDIDFSSFTWNYNASNNSVIFRGTLNGNGKKISNLTITNTSTSYLYHGIFPRAIGASIYDLTLENVHLVTTLSGTSQRSGLLIGRAEGGTVTLSDIKLIGCGSQGNSTNGVGGLVGNVRGSTTIVNLDHIKATDLRVFNDNTYVGGLVGRIATSGATVNFTDIDFEGDVYSNKVSSNTVNSYAGGLIGHVPSGGKVNINRVMVEATFQNTLVTAENFLGYSNRYLGGFVGYNQSGSNNVKITDAFFTGSLFTRIDARRSDVGTAVGQDSQQAQLTRVYYSNVIFRGVGGVSVYTVSNPVGQMATLVVADAMPDLAWWNSFYTNFESNSLWLQDLSGKLYLNL